MTLMAVLDLVPTRFFLIYVKYVNVKLNYGTTMFNPNFLHPWSSKIQI